MFPDLPRKSAVCEGLGMERKVLLSLRPGIAFTQAGQHEEGKQQ